MFGNKKWKKAKEKRSKKKKNTPAVKTAGKQKNCKAAKSTKNIPLGRTLSTKDNYMMGQKDTKSTKERPVVVIEINSEFDLVVIPLSTRDGKNKTQLKNYQQGQSYYKHFIEIEDDEGKPIRVNEKFRENHSNMDVSMKDTIKMKDKVLNHSKTSAENKKKMQKFLSKNKKSPQD